MAIYQDLKELSPFNGRILIGVDYGSNCVRLSGDLQNLIDEIIGQKHNLRIYDADKYFLSIPGSALNDAKVVWAYCGTSGIKGPRKGREN